MSAATRAAATVLIMAGVAAGLYHYWQSGVESPAPSMPPMAANLPATPAPSDEPAIRHPIAPDATQPAAAPTALPALADSDPEMESALRQLLGNESWLALVHPDRIIRRIVATVDNLPRKQAPVGVMPVKPVGSAFAAQRAGNDLSIGPANPKRYDAYLSLLQAVDAGSMVAVYRRFYPLFQQAYVELGYPKGYFNDRLVEVVDHLLAAPDIDGSIALVQPKVLYQFADPELEARSAGHKILMRMGKENAAKVKAKLREIRSELTRG